MRSCPHCKKPIGHGRSGDDHKRLFALFSAAHHHWPKRHAFQPDDPEHLRAWLLCKVGFRTVSHVEVPSDNPAIVKLAMLAAEGAVKAAKGYVFFKPEDGGFSVGAPRSLSFDKCDQKTFGRVREAVEQQIQIETGIDPETMLKEHERAA